MFKEDDEEFKFPWKVPYAMIADQGTASVILQEPDCAFCQAMLDMADCVLH